MPAPPTRPNGMRQRCAPMGAIAGSPIRTLLSPALRRLVDEGDMIKPEELVTFVTTDIAAITRGRAVSAASLPDALSKGVGWVPANLSLTPFDEIASPNPFGSSGDLRLIPAREAGGRGGVGGRFRRAHAAAFLPFRHHQSGWHTVGRLRALHAQGGSGRP